MHVRLVGTNLMAADGRGQSSQGPGASGGDRNRGTGIFYHPSFSRGSYLTKGRRLEHFPDVLEDILRDPRFILFEPEPISEEWILEVHSRYLLEGVKEDPLCSTAWHSAGSVFMGAQKIAAGEIRNGFSFIGAGGHHAGRNYFGGFCCFNDVAIAMRMLTGIYGINRFAILDTDAHHGDGTRELVRRNPDILHVCVCSKDDESEDGTKVDIASPVRSDAAYVRAAIEGFSGRTRRFGPEFLFWYFGFDTHQGDYGSLGLTVDAYLPIARTMTQLADELCAGRLLVVLGGGSRSDIARSVIPPIISVLGEQSSQ